MVKYHTQIAPESNHFYTDNGVEVLQRERKDSRPEDNYYPCLSMAYLKCDNIDQRSTVRFFFIFLVPYIIQLAFTNFIRFWTVILSALRVQLVERWSWWSTEIYRMMTDVVLLSQITIDQLWLPLYGLFGTTTQYLMKTLGTN